MVQTFRTSFLKQSIFKTSEALQKWEGMILKKTRFPLIFMQFWRSYNMNRWPLSTTSRYVHCTLHIDRYLLLLKPKICIIQTKTKRRVRWQYYSWLRIAHTRDWSPKFATELNVIIGCSSKSIWVTKMILPWGDYFGKRTVWSLEYFLSHVYFYI